MPEADPDLPVPDSNPEEIGIGDLCIGSGHVHDAMNCVRRHAQRLIFNYPSARLNAKIGAEIVEWKQEYNLRARVPDFFYCDCRDFTDGSQHPKEVLSRGNRIEVGDYLLKQLRVMAIGFPCRDFGRLNPHQKCLRNNVLNGTGVCGATFQGCASFLEQWMSLPERCQASHLSAEKCGAH